MQNKSHYHYSTNRELTYRCLGNGNKPLELYLFIDPICPECWALEPILKKLQIEYGHYFTLKYVLSGNLATLNINRKKYEGIADLWEKTASRTGMSCDEGLWFEDPISSPFIASVAIKAAELQGRRAGTRFLRKLQEVLFLQSKNISNINVLMDCAKEVNLDIDEFVADIHSESAAKAFQCDLKITSEMEVSQIPTLVFFNEKIEDEGIKITGYYPYDVYEQILTEMLSYKPRQARPPSLIEFLQCFRIVSTNDIAIVYNLSALEVEREMKKLQLQQIVKELPVTHGTVWKYIKEG